MIAAWVVRKLRRRAARARMETQPRPAAQPGPVAAGAVITARSLIKRYGPVVAVDGGEKAAAYCTTLSGGQLQRLSLALALVNDPDLVFLDEPTTGLDPAARLSLWAVIEAVRGRGKTVVMTTHYMEEAERLCDRI